MVMPENGRLELRLISNAVMCLAILAIALLPFPQPVAGDFETPLEILVYGATGQVGVHLVDEGLARGHRVTAVSRDPSRIERDHENLRKVQGDILDRASVASLVESKDVVIISVRGISGAGESPVDAVPYVGLKNVVSALQKPGHDDSRLIHVGGSGSLEVEPGKLFADQLPKFLLPKHLELEIAGQVVALGYLRTITDVQWTYATPAKNFTNGDRTGEFRIGGDRLMEDSRGKSRISRADFAVALIDEAENGQFIRERFSVAY